MELNDSIITCPGLDPIMEDLTEYQLYIFFALEITITTLILLTNTVVILTILKTKQHEKRAMSLVILLSVSDIFVAMFSQTFKLRYFYSHEEGHEEHNCSFYILIFTVTNYFPLFSFYTIFISIYNNYMKLKYTHEFLEKLDKLKLISHLFYLAVLALLQSVTVGIAVAINLHFITSLVTPFEFIGFIVASVMQYRSFKRIKEIEGGFNPDEFQYVNKDIFHMGIVYLITSAILKSPVFFSELSVYITKISSNTQSVAIVLGYALANCTSITSAISFVVINEEACKCCKQFLRRHLCKKKGRVLPERKGINETE